jgi:uroporphyrinogen-III synthase
VTVLYTHNVEPRPEGIAEALAFDARGATLVISSKETVNYLLPLVRAPFAQMVAVGEGTGELLRKIRAGGSGASLRKVKANTQGTGDFPGKKDTVGTLGKTNTEGTRDFLRKGDTGERLDSTSAEASTYSGASETQIVVPTIPGAAGVIDLLRRSSSPVGVRMLWPHGSDAAPEPLEQVRALGVQLVAPVVYEKRPLSRSEVNPSILSDVRAKRFAAVAVGSTAALDVFLASLGSVDVPPNVRWGVLGPETAKAVTARGLPPPSIPPHARLSELLDLLRKEIR